MDAVAQVIYHNFTSGPGLVLGLTVITYLYYLYASSWRVIPKGIPWFFSESGKSSAPSWYAQIKAHFSDFNQGVNYAHQGYEKFSKNGVPFVAPSFVSWQPEVVLPPAHIQWLVEQPDTVLSINEALIKDLEFLYTTPAAWSFTRPFHVEALNKLRMESLIPNMAEEVQDSIDKVWGKDTENWNEVNIEDTMRHVLVQITARVIVGSPLCRNTEYIENAHNFMLEIGPRAVLIGFTPELLRPLAGWWFSRPLKQWNVVCANYMIPLVKQEMAHRRPSDQKTMPAPKTLLEQMARIAVRSTDPRDTDPFSISSRLLGLNFVAVHTSCASLTNAVLDMMSPPAGESVFHELRAEAKTVHDSCQGKWTKARVNQLEKIDSALRESLRISTFKARGLERVVVAPKGVTLPDGTHLRKGTNVVVPVLPIHHDKEIYPDADQYKPLRFYSSRSAATQTGDHQSASSQHGHVELINSSETFLAFGHGKHACPGRFMAAYELKLIIAYISMHYDIQPFEERPPNAVFSDFNVGTMHSVKVRRRKPEVH
ncbi:hypothetical protein D0867_02790 [Hortaea werneckii]|uniref:Cytochrome P450 n=1 Tax=Hortaea werneckii TaxID=91943 RepID=A0A3M7A4D7_HORWE|nr:hypothetical protein D0867_02790 [Hortaea werneckii]RMY42101.1 hypothetical protein D0866_00162 [Hortaea werneckii]